MDAYGNLDSIDDFVVGVRLRLVSRLDPDVVFGVKYETVPSVPGMLIADSAQVNRLSTDDPQFSVLTVTSVYEGVLNLSWVVADGAQYQIYFTDVRGRPLDMNYPAVLELQEAEEQIAYDGQLCNIDFVDGCWFALNNWDRSMVADIYESGTASGNQIINFPWNGGDNQIWRAQKL